MKNKLSVIKTTLLLLVATICTTQAQWTTTGSNVYTTGKVGIGMNAPLYTLDISGGGVSTAINHLSGSATSHTQYALGRTAVESRISIASSAGDFTTDAAAGDFVIRNEGGGRKILFNTNAGLSTSSMAISGNNIGIGTTNPNNELHIKAVSPSITADILLEAPSKLWQLSGRNDRFAVINTSTSTDYFTILNSGNVGIGTITPNAQLQFGNTTNSRKIVLFEDANNDNQVYGFGVNPSTLRYQVSSSAGNHIFYAGSSATASNELMRIQGNGNVGIGTTAPSALLHVAGGDLRVDGRIAIGGNMNTLAGVALSVNGSIYSKATYVTVNGWSDNIFDSEYQLKGLEEVEEYIKKHKHLPSIPSEKEIMEKGLDTGEMLKLQMAKIEELTIYLIDQKKEIKELKKEVATLKKQK